MKELIKVHYDNNTPLVSARELYEFLEPKSRYNDWFDRMCEYGFNENIDFYSEKSKSSGGRPAINHQLSIEMAKEICMLQRNEKGKQARQYFIQLEKLWNSPEMVMKRALEFANQKVDELMKLVTEQKEEIKVKDEEIEYKENVIIGLVDDIDLATKRQRINQILRRGCGRNGKKLAERWGLLYTEFSKKYHINLNIRLKRHKHEYKPCLKNRLDVIDRNLNMIPELYEITCKLFENDYEALMKTWESSIK